MGRWPGLGWIAPSGLSRAVKTTARWKSRKAGERALRYIFPYVLPCWLAQSVSLRWGGSWFAPQFRANCPVIQKFCLPVGTKSRPPLYKPLAIVHTIEVWAYTRHYNHAAACPNVSGRRAALSNPRADFELARED
jgi:hypothetical protein